MMRPGDLTWPDLRTEIFTTMCGIDVRKGTEKNGDAARRHFPAIYKKTLRGRISAPLQGTG